MALTTANGVGVIEGTIVRPLVGVGTMDLKLDQVGSSPTGFTPGTQVTVASAGGYSVVGVVDPNRGGSFLDSVHVRVICGAGGMAQLAPPRSFGQALVRDVISWLLKNAGETLSSTADAGLLATSLPAWTIMGHTVGWNLRALLRIVAPTMNWRILADGTVWIGNETWPAASGTFDTMDQDPADGSYVLGVEAPFVVPGTSIAGLGNVNRCIDVIVGGKMRTHVYVDFPSEGARGINASVARQVAQAMAGIDYNATYLCDVVTQSQDLTTVDVQPHNARTKQLLGGGLQGVTVRSGAGMKIQLNKGATVLLAWDGGDPRYPYVHSSLGGDPTTWTLNGDLVLQHLSSTRVKIGGVSTSPVSSDTGKVIVDPTSTDRSGLLHLQGISGAFSVDISFANPNAYPNGCRVHVRPANQAAADNEVCANDNSGATNTNMVVYATGETAAKFTLTNKASLQSAKTAGGDYKYIVEGY